MSRRLLEQIAILAGGGALILALFAIKAERDNREIQNSLESYKDDFVEKKNWQAYQSEVRQKTRKLASTSPQSKDSVSKEIYVMRKRLLITEECYVEPEKCSLPKTDPKSEFFAVGTKLRSGLNELFHLAVEKNIKSRDLEVVARHFLKVPDGHVKEAALHLLTTQEKSEVNMEAILKEIINYHDAQLIEHAMLELQFYLEDPDQAHRVHTALNYAIRTGSLFVSQEITKHLRPFINQTSLALYTHTMKNLEIGSRTRKHIENAIREFRLSLESA